jgi:RimJ/RimL family protein N-acetyltransferase
MTDYAHRTPAIPTLTAEIEPDNQASIAVVEAAGFQLTDLPPVLVTKKERTYALLTWTHTP